MTGLAIHRYELVQKSALNRADLSVSREGVLLRTAEGGVACIQPWPELGDPSLAECLVDLGGKQSFSLVRQALHCAALDGEARAEGRFLFSGVSVPKSHATLPRLTQSALNEAEQRGFTTLKVKRGKDWMALRKKTAQLMEDFPQFRWRFDFNGALSSHRELHLFLASLPRERIDFVEDPFEDHSLMVEWQGDVPLGYDRSWGSENSTDHAVLEVAQMDALNQAQNGVLVVKPALQSRDLLRTSRLPVVVTSYMDHPIGQLFAAYEAAHFFQTLPPEQVPICGLVTHGLYEENPFSRALGEPGPRLSVPAGTGLGFDEELAALDWKAL